MKANMTTSPSICIGLLESDPLRKVGFQAIFDLMPEFRVMFLTSAQISTSPDIDLLLLGNHSPGFFEVMAMVRTTLPDLPVLVTGTNMDDEAVLRAIMGGAKGCVDEAATAATLAQAIHVVHRGTFWASRRIMATLIGRSCELLKYKQVNSSSLTFREKQVLSMLVEGRSNKEIAQPLGIEERTVKAHVAKLLRKVGARNRIALSMQAIKCSLVSVQ